MWKRGFVGLAVFLIAACASPTPAPNQSPLVSPLSSPVAMPELVLKGPNFEVSPLKASDKSVSGHGPIGIPIVIVDVTLSAKPLGNGTIDDTGKFVIDLSTPALAGHAVGIQVVDLENTSHSPTEEVVAALDAKAGPGFQYYPLIGAVYAQTQVSP